MKEQQQHAGIQHAKAQPPQQQPQPGATPEQQSSADPSRIWLPEVVHHLARFMSSNQVACTLRLVNKAAAAQFGSRLHTNVRLSLPVPHHAFARRWGSPGATRSLTVRQRRQLPCLVARSGSVANLEVLLARDDLTTPLDTAVLQAAAGAGKLEACRWLRQQGCAWDSDVLDAAAGNGRTAVCEWLLAERCPRSRSALEKAAGGGHRHICERLLATGDAVDARAVTAAAQGGHAGLLDWLLARTADGSIDVRSLLVAAASSCDLPTLQRLERTHRGVMLPVADQERVAAAAAGSPTADWRAKVEWLERRGYPRTERACAEAAQPLDGPERLAWLRQRGYPLTGAAALRAVQHDRADTLEFLLASGVALTDAVAGATAFEAAHHGRLAALKVLHAHGYAAPAMNNVTVAAVASHGHLPVLAWLLESLGAADIVLSANAVVMAAMSGSTELLAWLRQRGAPWGAAVFAAAARVGSEEQLEWLAAQGCPMGDDGEPYRRALMNADLTSLYCLRRLGCAWNPLGRTFTAAVEACCAKSDGVGRKQLLLAVLWLLQQGCPVDWAAAEHEAGRWGDGEMLAWVKQQRLVRRA